MQLYDSSFKRKKMILICVENQYVMIFIEKSQKKNIQKVCRFKKNAYLCNRNRERKQRKKNLMVRQFSWLEYMPVTHGVTGSSPVRTAKKSWFILNQDFLFHISGKIKKTGTCRTWHIPVNRVNAYSNTSPFSVYNTAVVLSSASVRTTLQVFVPSTSSTYASLMVNSA